MKRSSGEKERLVIWFLSPLKTCNCSWVAKSHRNTGASGTLWYLVPSWPEAMNCPGVIRSTAGRDVEGSDGHVVASEEGLFVFVVEVLDHY